MASLSVNLPWQPFVAPRLPELDAGLHREMPAVELAIELGADVVLVHVDAGGMLNPAEVAHAVAVHLAPMWPSFLEGYGVKLAVTVDGSTWTAGPAVMGATPAMTREAWLSAAEFTLR